MSDMVRYILSRLLAMAITLFVIISLSFFVIRLMPGNIFDHPDLPPHISLLLEERMGLGRPLYVQYFNFVRNVMRGDFGTSLVLRPALPVFQVVRERVGITMLLNLMSLAISLPLGVLAGTLAALNKDKIPDHLVSIFVVLFISVPSFVFAALLQYLLTFLIPIFPAIYMPGNAVSLTLPVVALSLGPMAVVARYLRGELIEVMSGEFMLLARAKGMSRGQAVARHALRNSCVPLVNVIVPMFTGIMAGSLVVERIFAVPGMGGIMVDAINAGDDQLTIAVLLFFSIISLSTVLIMDISYGLLDPRIKIGGKKND